MPSVEYDMGDLTHLIGGPLDIEELKQVVPMLGVDLGFVDWEKIELEVFPNRPDMLSIEGFARALKGYLGRETGLRNYLVEESEVVLMVDSSVDSVRKAVSSSIVSQVVLDDYTVKSLMNVQEKLHLTHGRNRFKVAVGVHDLDKVEPPFTYKAVEPESVSFVPLDMSEELNLSEILERHPKGRDYAWCLEGKDRYPVFVDNKGQVLSFPPIINGELTRLTDSSRNLFIEMTGTDQYAVDVANNIITTSLSDRGGKIQSVLMKRA